MAPSPSIPARDAASATRRSLALLLLAFAPAFGGETVTGRPEPTLRGDFSEVQPMLKTLRDCEAEVEREAREAAAVARGRGPSALARTQSVKECEATNAMWRQLNAEEVARVRSQNAARAADAERARARLEEARALFEAEEKEVARLLAAWLPRVDASYRPDGLALLEDNPHLLVGATVAGPLRLVERLSPGAAIASYGDALLRIDGLPPHLALFSSRPFVMIGKVVDVVRLDATHARQAPVARVEWMAGGDCALAASPAAPQGVRCLPWMGLRRRLPP